MEKKWAGIVVILGIILSIAVAFWNPSFSLTGSAIGETCTHDDNCTDVWGDKTCIGSRIEVPIDFSCCSAPNCVSCEGIVTSYIDCPSGCSDGSCIGGGEAYCESDIDCPDDEIGTDYCNNSQLCLGTTLNYRCSNNTCVYTPLIFGQCTDCTYGCSDGECVTSVSCALNWTAFNTSCSEDDTLVMYYVDLNECNSTYDMPFNRTYSCDYDGNGLIGSVSDIAMTRLDLDLEVNDQELNESGNYIGTETVEFIEDNQTIIEFEWNFDNALDFDDIEITRQSETDTRGYLIVNGLEANKTLLVDRLSNGTAVCIKDREVSSIGAVSPDCDDDNETLVNCPGTANGYSCTIVGDKFQVTGVMHSAIQETEGENVTTCVADWNCTDWGDCLAGIETRTCTDLNVCNTTVGKPSESQTCQVCIANWNCGNWSKCEDGTQTRTCTDLNACGTLEGKPSESQECEEPSALKFVIITIIILLIIAVIVTLIILMMKGKKQAAPGVAASPAMGPSPPSPPGPRPSSPAVARPIAPTARPTAARPVPAKPARPVPAKPARPTRPRPSPVKGPSPQPRQ